MPVLTAGDDVWHGNGTETWQVNLCFVKWPKISKCRPRIRGFKQSAGERHCLTKDTKFESYS